MRHCAPLSMIGVLALIAAAPVAGAPAIELHASGPIRTSHGGVDYVLQDDFVWATVDLGGLAADSVTVTLDGLPYFGEPIVFVRGETRMHLLLATATWLDPYGHERRHTFARHFEFHDELRLSAQLDVSWNVVPAGDAFDVRGTITLHPHGFTARSVHPGTIGLRLTDADGMMLGGPIGLGNEGCDGEPEIEVGSATAPTADTVHFHFFGVPEPPAALRINGKSRSDATEAFFFAAYGAPGRAQPAFAPPNGGGPLGAQIDPVIDIPDPPDPGQGGDPPHPPDCELEGHLELGPILVIDAGTPPTDVSCGVTDVSFFSADVLWRGGWFYADAYAVDECIGTSQSWAESMPDTARVVMQTIPVNCCFDCRTTIVGNPTFVSRTSISGGAGPGNAAALSAGVIAISGPRIGDTSCDCAAIGGSAAGTGTPATVAIGGWGVPIANPGGDDSAHTAVAVPACNAIYQGDDGICDFTVLIVGVWKVDILANRGPFGTNAFADADLTNAKVNLTVTTSCVECDHHGESETVKYTQ